MCIELTIVFECGHPEVHFERCPDPSAPGHRTRYESRYETGDCSECRRRKNRKPGPGPGNPPPGKGQGRSKGSKGTTKSSSSKNSSKTVQSTGSMEHQQYETLNNSLDQQGDGVVASSQEKEEEYQKPSAEGESIEETGAEES